MRSRHPQTAPRKPQLPAHVPHIPFAADTRKPGPRVGSHNRPRPPAPSPRYNVPVKLGIIGLGFMGSTHAKAALQLPGVQLTAVCDNKDELALTGDFSNVRGNSGDVGGKADFTGVAKYRDISKLLADPNVEAIDICLPTGMHERVAVDALRAGKHVLVEKPMALDGAAADRIVAEAETCGRILMTAQVIRFWPEYVALRDTLINGSLGPLRTAVFRRRCAAPSWGVWETPGSFDLLIHDVDFTIHLLGKPEAISSYGYYNEAAGIDILHAHFLYSNGVEALVTGGWHNRGDYPFSMEYTATFEQDTMEFSTASGVGVLKSAPGAAYAAEIAHFAESVDAGRQPVLCPPRESADAIKLTLLAIEARKHKGEKIPCNL
jgi:predicted dehydrogenase